MISQIILKYKPKSLPVKLNIKLLYTFIKVVGTLGVILFNFRHVKKFDKSQLKMPLYFIKPMKTSYLANSFIISKFLIHSFFKDFANLLFGVNYGWFFSFNIAGRGFSFRLKKKNTKNFLKLKIGYSHFVFLPLVGPLLVKIAKKRNKLVIFSLNFWILSKIVYQLRRLRSRHTYKIQGIFFFNEKIKIKPGKKKQI